MPKAEIARRVSEIADTLGLADHLKRKPKQLSGGQRQRVAMGRAIVRNPSVFLMDEPLSNLDAKLRVQMRAEISRIQRQLAATTMYVTHDQVEAMTMGDRVAVLHKGELQQLGAPQEIYDHPINLVVASFIGSPGMNLFRARLERHESGFACALRGQQIVIPASSASARPELANYVGRDVGVGIRPEHVDDVAFAPEERRVRLRGRVVLTEALGSEQIVHLEIEADPLLTQDVLEVAKDIDDAAAQELEADAEQQRTLFVGRFDARSTAAAGDEIELSIDGERMHFFDIGTGLTIGAPR